MGPEDSYIQGANDFLFKDPVDSDEEENQRELDGDHKFEEKEGR